jgi:hypothetical protein
MGSLPAYNMEASTVSIYNTSKPIWTNIFKHGAGPRVDDYMFVTDSVGMQLCLESGLMKCCNNLQGSAKSRKGEKHDNLVFNIYVHM